MRGQGPTIILRRHECADLPGENPSAWRWEVWINGEWKGSGVGPSFERAALNAQEITTVTWQEQSADKKNFV